MGTGSRNCGIPLHYRTKRDRKEAVASLQG
jgi:hypothetical protein